MSEAELKQIVRDSIREAKIMPQGTVKPKPDASLRSDMSAAKMLLVILSIVIGVLAVMQMRESADLRARISKLEASADTRSTPEGENRLAP